MKAWTAKALALTLFAAAAATGAAAPALAGDNVVVKGNFEGRSKHITTGGVTIKKSGDGYVVEWGENFSLDGAPDPKLGFGKGGKFDHGTTFSELKSKTGGQSYTTGTFDGKKHDEIYVWCEKFNVPLGVATLK